MMERQDRINEMNMEKEQEEVADALEKIQKFNKMGKVAPKRLLKKVDPTLVAEGDEEDEGDIMKPFKPSTKGLV